MYVLLELQYLLHNLFFRCISKLCWTMSWNPQTKPFYVTPHYTNVSHTNNFLFTVFWKPISYQSINLIPIRVCPFSDLNHILYQYISQVKSVDRSNFMQIGSSVRKLFSNKHKYKAKSLTTEILVIFTRSINA